MDPSHKIILNNKEITSEENVLGIHLDNKLNFVYHIASLCITSPQIRNSVVKSQFSYCPLTWVFASRYSNNALFNSIHQQALRLVYNNYELPFDRMLEEIKQKIIKKMSY